MTVLYIVLEIETLIFAAMSLSRLLIIALILSTVRWSFAEEFTASGPVDVPDEFGLGERLALVAWLREHKVKVSDTENLSALRLAYLRTAHPDLIAAQQSEDQAKQEEAALVDALKSKLWLRHNRIVEGTPSALELKTLLARLDSEAEIALAAQRAETNRLEHLQALQEQQTKQAAATADKKEAASSPIAKTTAPLVSGSLALPTEEVISEPPAGSWREAQSEAGATYRLLYAEVVEPLKQRTGNRPAWYAKAMGFMIDTISRETDPIAERAISSPGLIFNELQAAGCNDPGVLALACLHYGACRDDPDRLMAALAHDGYSLRLQQACAIHMLRNMLQLNTLPQIEAHQKYLNLVCTLGIQLLHTDLSNPRLTSMIARQLVTVRNIFYPNNDSIDCLKIYTEEIARCEGTDNAVNPWLAAMVRGQFELMLGWKARGNQVASLVTETGWEEFNLRQEAAKKQFELAWTLDPSQPLAASMRIAIAMGMSEGSESIFQWLDKAIKVCPDHKLAYTMAQMALSPSWGGSPELQVEVGRRALRTGDFSSPAAYFYYEFIHQPGLHGTWEESLRVQRGYIDSPFYAEIHLDYLYRLIQSAYDKNLPNLVISCIKELGEKPNPERLGPNSAKIIELYFWSQGP